VIKYESAIEIIRNNLILIGTERTDIKESTNRVLREDIFSDMDMPPFNKSAMDGYACRREDIAVELDVVEIIAAGCRPQKFIGKNQCAKIMTGAMMPEGADCVIIIEDVEETGSKKIKFLNDKTADNFCLKGEDVKTGEKLLSAGTRITTKQIASLALSGNTNPLVSIKPKVGILSTGDEIVEPYVKPAATQIRNTNSYQIIAQCIDFGVVPTYYGIVSDTKEAIGSAIDKAKQENDLVILTGGVSMGDFDLVPDLLKEKGFNILFDKIAVQPGKPAVFGRDRNKFVFGMPGNPVSSFIVFEFMVKEFLAGMMGLTNHEKMIRCELANDYSRKHNSRLARIPVKINENGKAEIIEYHGSAHINSYALAEGVISIPIGVNEIKKGSVVDVRQF
jgi:molybdopterin molybdotransferase